MPWESPSLSAKVADSTGPPSYQRWSLSSSSRPPTSPRWLWLARTLYREMVVDTRPGATGEDIKKFLSVLEWLRPKQGVLSNASPDARIQPIYYRWMEDVNDPATSTTTKAMMSFDQFCGFLELLDEDALHSVVCVLSQFHDHDLSKEGYRRSHSIAVTQKWCDAAGQIFSKMDSENCGSITALNVLPFVLCILSVDEISILSEAGSHVVMALCFLFTKDIGEGRSLVTFRDWKRYLVKVALSESELISLASHVQAINASFEMRSAISSNLRALAGWEEAVTKIHAQAGFPQLGGQTAYAHIIGLCSHLRTYGAIGFWSAVLGTQPGVIEHVDLVPVLRPPSMEQLTSPSFQWAVVSAIFAHFCDATKYLMADATPQALMSDPCFRSIQQIVTRHWESVGQTVADWCTCLTDRNVVLLSKSPRGVGVHDKAIGQWRTLRGSTVVRYMQNLFSRSWTAVPAPIPSHGPGPDSGPPLRRSPSPELPVRKAISPPESSHNEENPAESVHDDDTDHVDIPKEWHKYSSGIFSQHKSRLVNAARKAEWKSCLAPDADLPVEMPIRYDEATGAQVQAEGVDGLFEAAVMAGDDVARALAESLSRKYDMALSPGLEDGRVHDIRPDEPFRSTFVTFSTPKQVKATPGSPNESDSDKGSEKSEKEEETKAKKPMIWVQGANKSSVPKVKPMKATPNMRIVSASLVNPKQAAENRVEFDSLGGGEATNIEVGYDVDAPSVNENRAAKADEQRAADAMALFGFAPAGEEVPEKPVVPESSQAVTFQESTENPVDDPGSGVGIIEAEAEAKSEPSAETSSNVDNGNSSSKKPDTDSHKVHDDVSIPWLDDVDELIKEMKIPMNEKEGLPTSAGDESEGRRPSHDSGSKSASVDGSQPASVLGSKPSSRPHSRPPSNAGSKPSSRPPSRGSKSTGAAEEKNPSNEGAVVLQARYASDNNIPHRRSGKTLKGLLSLRNGKSRQGRANPSQNDEHVAATRHRSGTPQSRPSLDRQSNASSDKDLEDLLKQQDEKLKALRRTNEMLEAEVQSMT